MRKGNVFFTRTSATVLFFVAVAALSVYGQSAAPEWIHETWRNAHYPLSEWYVGFSEDNAGQQENIAKSVQRVERYAMNKMVENISVRISSDIQAKETAFTNSGSAAGGGFAANYSQTIKSSASAEIANLERRSHHDRETGRVYALAAVRRQDFAAHCVSRAEHCLQKAENTLAEARLLPVGEKKNEAGRRVTESLDEGARYLDLLAAVGRGSDELKRLRAGEAELRKKISVKEKVAVYVAGKEARGTQGLHRVLGNALATAINASRYYSAEDKTGYRLDWPMEPAQIKDLGRRHGVEYLCIAEASPTKGGVYDLSARLVNAGTAEQMFLAAAHSGLDEPDVMRLASAELASKLMGKDSLAKAIELEQRERERRAAEISAVKPVTEESRQIELAERSAASNADAYMSAYPRDGEYSLPAPPPTFGSAGAWAQETPASGNESAGDRPGGRPRYGARFAGVALLGGAQSGSGGNYLEAKSEGMSISAGVTMSFPVTDVISFNPELSFDARRMDLSVTPPEGGLYGKNGAMEYAMSLPLLVRAEGFFLYAEAGLAFGYPLQSGLDFAGAERAQIEMAGAAGAGLALGAHSSTRHYIGYRFESNITDFDDKGYCRFYRHSLGYTILF